jgi:hypothetical protein
MSKLDRGIAKATARIKDRVAFADLKRGKNLGAVERQSIDQDMPPSNEFGDERRVPEINIRAPCSGGDFGVAHDRSS